MNSTRQYPFEIPGDERVVDRKSVGVESAARILAPEDLTVIKDPLRALETATTVSDIKSIRDKAEAVRKYAQNARLGLNVQNKAAELKLRAERKAGMALASMSLHGGDRRSKRHHERLKLSDLGISQSQSRRWQMEAAVPEATFQRFIEAANSKYVEITASGLLKIARALRQANDEDTCDASIISSSVSSHRQDLVDELLNHCRLFDSLISPIYSSDESESVNLRNGERKMLRRLVREFTQLLTTLQQKLDRDDRRS